MTPRHKKILEIARSLIGTPYKYAVPTEETPRFLDCSSFTQYVYKQIGIEIPRSTILQATLGKEITDLKNLEPGDLILHRGSKGHYNDELFPGKHIYIGHITLYTGGDKVIHSTSKNGVMEENLETVLISHGPVVLIKRII
ncbi:MAG: NLP/P60 protein [Parcubacteria group bacterium Athens0714_26]|nr:MAG: NLP/P60 protein [Parcubacteria group bacterium Athens1014_26]TSD03629.1 MAG: NLP/P60 protein [Parcubacteria group bacterium Athens0714_26]